MIKPSALMATLLLAGCANFSGLDASPSFACKAPAGVSCQSISGVEANAAAGNLPFQREDPAKSFGAGDQRADGRDPEGVAKPLPYGNGPGGGERVSPKDMVAVHSGMPVRQPPLVLRVWVAPYEDDDKDLHDQSYFYTVVHSGRWMIEANTTAITNQYRPTYPLSKMARPEAEPADKEQQPLVKKGEYRGLAEKQSYQAE